VSLVEVESLSVQLPVAGELRHVLRDVSFSIEEGESLALVGESGAGKSITGRAMTRLLPPQAVAGGRVTLAGEDMLSLRSAQLRSARGRIGVIFQDPRAHINPVRRIGDFMTEQLRAVQRTRRADARSRAIAGLEAVGIADGERRLSQFPHELSGGLLQRVMIATVLLAEPRIIIADEPTTALDVTTQSEVMAILDEVRRTLGVAMLFITHDLDLAAAVCDSTAVMYAGQLVECQPSISLSAHPMHPYSAALSAARPDIEGELRRLPAIPGRAVACWQAPQGCSFAPRCSYRREACTAAEPEMRGPEQSAVRCVRSAEIQREIGAAVA
jgi:oligopeptide/dipeptide ABC transporter ATP-binding protein